MGSGEGSIMRNFIVCHRSPYVVRVIKSRRLSWAGYVAKIEEGRSNFKILTGTPAGKRPLRNRRRRWEDIIRMDLKGMGIKTRD